jgi:L-asparaginase II
MVHLVGIKQNTCKTGADGVYCLSFIEQKLGCCIKIDDGLMGPQYAVAQAIIEKLGLLDEESIKKLHPYLEENILNWNGWTVGKQIVCPTVLDDLKI